MPLTPGTRLGPYEITAQIGIGGMGEVYRATDRNLGRDVALKVLPEAFAQDAERLARFEREAKTLASVNHPNIATVYGVEAVDGVRALVMELVDGETLAERIARGPIPTGEALALAREMAAALEAAHEQGIIHRDLKPANIKVRSDGTVKVLDFGLAKAIVPAVATSHATLSPTITTPAMTQMGVILGTAAYMSPEQAKGREADKRSDVWALGAVVYEMLTGRRAFDGGDMSETLATVIKSDPEWTALPADVPPAVRTMLRACLQKDPRKRTVDATTALFVLNEPALGNSANATVVGTTTADQRSIWTRSIRVLVGVALTAAVIGGIAWTLRPPSTTPLVTRFSFSLPEGQQFTNTGRSNLAISPDGTQIAHVANRRLYLRSMSNPQSREIQGSESAEGVTTPSFSPDGQWIAFVVAGEQVLKRISVDGGVAVPICPIATSLGVSWGSDGIVFGQRPGSIFRVSPNGGKPELIFEAGNGESAYNAQMLPGGDALLVTMGRVADGSNTDLIENPRIVWQSLRSRERTTLIERGADARYIPTGHIVYADGDALLAVRFDLQRRQVIGDSVPLVEGVRRGTATPAGQFGVSTNGSLAYLPGTTADGQSLALLDRQGGGEVLKLRSAAYNSPRLSPDGTRVAVEINDGRGRHIWIYDLSGTLAVRQLTLEGENRFPVWSPDGERVAFLSTRGGDAGLWSQRADGRGAAERLTQPDKGTIHTPLSWHPRESTLLYHARGASRNSTLWTYSLVDKKSSPVAGVESSQLLSAQFSPDGRWVAYHTAERPGGSLTQAVFVRPYPSMDATVHAVAAGSHPHWSPDGAELFFVVRGIENGQSPSLFVTRITTQPRFAISVPMEVPMRSWIRDPSRNFDITPDGKRFVTVVESASGETNVPRVEVVLNWFEDVKRLVPVK